MKKKIFIAVAIAIVAISSVLIYGESTARYRERAVHDAKQDYVRERAVYDDAKQAYVDFETSRRRRYVIFNEERSRLVRNLIHERYGVVLPELSETESDALGEVVISRGWVNINTLISPGSIYKKQIEKVNEVVKARLWSEYEREQEMKTKLLHESGLLRAAAECLSEGYKVGKDLCFR